MLVIDVADNAEDWALETLKNVCHAQAPRTHKFVVAFKFYPWFAFYFPLFQTYYQTLP